jgi:hypothetical protein
MTILGDVACATAASPATHQAHLIASLIEKYIYNKKFNPKEINID